MWLGSVGSTATLYAVRAGLTACHVLPESVLRHTPSSFVAAYSTFGDVGSMPMPHTFGAVSVVMRVHVSPPSMLRHAPASVAR